MAEMSGIKISEEGLARLREELSTDEMRIGLARIQELLVHMKEAKHNDALAKKKLGLSDEELQKLDDDIEMDHGALYLKLELTLKEEFEVTDTKLVNRIMRLDIDKAISSFSLDMLEELAKRTLVVHDQNLERLRQKYFDDVEKQGQQKQIETEK